MLTMTCDRCGKEIPHGEGGRDRWRFNGRDLIVDLCLSCGSTARAEVLEMMETWANQPLEQEMKR